MGYNNEECKKMKNEKGRMKNVRNEECKMGNLFIVYSSEGWS
jgi:hypothetical protein